MIVTGSTMLRATSLQMRQKFIESHPPRCANCRGTKMKLRQWIRVPARWKCSTCRWAFMYEPIASG